MTQTKKKLFALLVAVDKYQISVPVMPNCAFGPLGGCVNDAQDMLDYLQAEDGFDLQFLFLKDENATKEAVTQAFETHLGQAEEGDVALFYYSGHGVQEYADTDIWKEESDGRLECLVCYNEAGKPCLLADKELRYLLSQVARGTAEVPKENPPHILTIFDCCHSGDNTRNGYMTSTDIRERQIKCIAPKRTWENFVFNKKIEKTSLGNKALSEVLPEGIHLHLAACESDESALEVDGHGVFTTHLLKVLKRANGDISYFNLMSQVRHYLRNIFSQKPQLRLPGDDSSGNHTTFLNKANTAKPVFGNVIYNQNKGWILDMGSLMGINLQMRTIEVSDIKNNKTYSAKIQRVQLDETELKFRGPDQPDKNKSYKGTVKGLMAHPIKVFINNHDGSPPEMEKLLDLMQKYARNMVLEEQETLADYTLQVRDCYYYITQADPKHLFRPIIKPVDYCTTGAEEKIVYYLQHLSQWEYVRRLRNAHTYLFDGNPIQIEAFLGGQNGERLNPSKNAFDLTPKQRADGKWKGKIAIKLTNTTTRKLYVSTLYLPVEFRVFLKGTDPQIYMLEPDESVWIFNWRKGEIGFSLDDMAKDYNWEFTEEFLKIIVSTTVFDVTRLEKKGLPKPPLSPGNDTRGKTKGALDLDDDEPEMIGDDWTTQNITLRFHNPMYNKVSKAHLIKMLQKEDMARYTRGLYVDTVTEKGGQLNYKIKPEIDLSVQEFERAGIVDIESLLLRQEKENRKAIFNRYLKQFPNRLSLVTLGGDWLHSQKSRSLADHFMGHFAVYQLPQGLIEAFESGQLQDTLTYTNAEQLIISDGLYALSGAINEHQIPQIIDQLQTTLKSIKSKFPDVEILVHGYDYFASDVDKYGVLIDDYNETLKEMASIINGVTYLDLRGSLHLGQWENDFLPNRDGFEVLAGRFFKEINID